MAVMRVFRMTLASLYLMASLFVVFAPHAAHAMSAPVVASAKDGCHGRLASAMVTVDRTAHDPCGTTVPIKHDGACMASGVCFDKLPGVTAHSAPLPVVASTVRVRPTPPSLRSGLHPRPDLRPPRLSV